MRLAGNLTWMHRNAAWADLARRQNTCNLPSQAIDDTFKAKKERT
jgi:hypothetical protein